MYSYVFWHAEHDGTIHFALSYLFICVFEPYDIYAPRPFNLKEHPHRIFGIWQNFTEFLFTSNLTHVQKVGCPVQILPFRGAPNRMYLESQL